MKIINKIHTSCKDCVFATWDGITQEDCKLDELSLFRNHDIEVLEVFDYEKEFYVINKTRCLKYRIAQWTHATEPFDQQKIAVEKEIELHCHAIIFVNDNRHDIRRTVTSLINQTLKPYYITLIRHVDCSLKPTELVEIIQDCPIKWRIENILEPRTDSSAIDMVVPFVKLPVYIVFYAGFEVPLKIFEELNNKVHKDFIQFAMIKPNSSNNGMVVLQKVHEAYQGNYQISLEEKLELDKCPNIVSINQICPNFPK